MRSTEWAEMLNSEGTIPDFHTQVPQMAYQWPFELDTFQKQAVLKLEQAESVFVAAHTSAGGSHHDYILSPALSRLKPPSHCSISSDIHPFTPFNTPETSLLLQSCS